MTPLSFLSLFCFGLASSVLLDQAYEQDGFWKKELRLTLQQLKSSESHEAKVVGRGFHPQIAELFRLLLFFP
jgi:hypothetical protein